MHTGEWSVLQIPAAFNETWQDWHEDGLCIFAIALRHPAHCADNNGLLLLVGLWDVGIPFGTAADLVGDSSAHHVASGVAFTRKMYQVIVTIQNHH